MANVATMRRVDGTSVDCWHAPLRLIVYVIKAKGVNVYTAKGVIDDIIVDAYVCQNDK